MPVNSSDISSCSVTSSPTNALVLLEIYSSLSSLLSSSDSSLDETSNVSFSISIFSSVSSIVNSSSSLLTVNIVSILPVSSVKFPPFNPNIFNIPLSPSWTSYSYLIAVLLSSIPTNLGIPTLELLPNTNCSSGTSPFISSENTTLKLIFSPVLYSCCPSSWSIVTFWIVGIFNGFTFTFIVSLTSSFVGLLISIVASPSEIASILYAPVSSSLYILAISSSDDVIIGSSVASISPSISWLFALDFRSLDTEFAIIYSSSSNDSFSVISCLLVYILVIDFSTFTSHSSLIPSIVTVTFAVPSFTGITSTFP